MISLLTCTDLIEFLFGIWVLFVYIRVIVSLF